MTSPWLAVLTSSPTMTFTPNSAPLDCASNAPEISLWSVTAIAPSPCSRAAPSSASTGVAQSLEWSVCMCRSTSISRRPAQPLARGRVPAAVVAAGDHARRRRPRARPPPWPVGRRTARSASRARNGGVQDRRARAGRRASPRRAARRAGRGGRPRATSSYTARREQTGTAPAASARPTRPGAGAAPSEAATSTSAPSSASSSASSSGVAKRTRSRTDGAQWGRRRRAAMAARRRPPSPRPARADAAHAGTAAAPGAPRASTNSSRVTPAGAVRASGGAGRLDRGCHDAVLGREVALHEVARGRVGGQPCVEAAEDPLGEAPGDLRGHHALERRVERADVERARVAQRRRRHVERERLVHVAEVQRGGREQLLERAGDVDRQRGRPARGPGRASPTASTRGASAGAGSSASPPARIARRPSRTRACDEDGATIRTRCPRPRARSRGAGSRRCVVPASSHGYGVTCASASGAATVAAGYDG